MIYSGKRSLWKFWKFYSEKIRSYGVSIVLLSQGISEYNQGNFDFSQECETAFLLPINDLNNTKAINKFLGLSEKDGSRTMRNLEKLDNGQCVSNIKELQKEICLKLFSIGKKRNSYMAEDSKTIFHELIYKFKQQRGKRLHILQ